MTSNSTWTLQSSSTDVTGKQSDAGEPSAAQRLNAVLKKITDKNGRITTAKLRNFVHEHQLGFTEEEIQDMMVEVESTSGGESSCKGLIRMVNEYNQEFPNIQITKEDLTKELTFVSNRETLTLASREGTMETQPRSAVTINEKKTESRATNRNRTSRQTPRLVAAGTEQRSISKRSNTRPESKPGCSKNIGETNQTANTEAIDAARLKEAFTTMADQDGRITSARLRTFIKQQGFDFTDDEIAEMMKVADPAESGDISYKGLVKLVREFSEEFPQVKLTKEGLRREITMFSQDESLAPTPTVSGTMVTATETTEYESEDVTLSSEQSQGTLVSSDSQYSRNTVQRTHGTRSRPSRSRQTVTSTSDGIDSLIVIPSNTVVKEDRRRVSVDNKSLQSRENTYTSETENTVPDESQSRQFGRDSVRNGNNSQLHRETPIETEAVSSSENASSHPAKVNVGMARSVSGTTRANAETHRVDITEGSEDESNEESDAEHTKIGGEGESEYQDEETVKQADESVPDSKTEENSFDGADEDVDDYHGYGHSSRKTFVPEVSIDQDVDTAMGMYDAMSSRRSHFRHEKEEKTQNNRKKSTTGKKETTQKQTTKTRPRPKAQRRVRRHTTQPEHKDPGYCSAIGCAYKLSQMRIRQRVLYLMWRAVYDEAIRKAENKRNARKAQRRKRHSVPT